MKNRIELEQINENEIEVVLPPETPMEMVQQLVKGLQARGLVEDLAKSTLSVRYFIRPIDGANTVADKLIKSLSKLTKDEELPYWHPKAQITNQKRNRDMAITARQTSNGVKPSAAPKPTPIAPSTLSPAAYTSPHAKIVDNTPAAMNTAGGTGRRYATINDPVKKEDDEDEMNKGPGVKFKGGSTYSVVDNIRRKANNTGDETGFGTNVNTKAYSSKPGQLSAKGQADVSAKEQAKANKNQPVKVFTEQEKADLATKMGLKKAWGQHLAFPSAEEEIMRLARRTPQSGEDVSANQLVSLMAGKQMLGEIPAAMQSMFASPPPQPTDEQMFGSMVVTEKMAKAADDKWNNTMNWLQEAQKPISQKFRSEAEEQAYWANIKISDRDDGGSGY